MARLPMRSTMKDRLAHHVEEMEAWATGKKSWTNMLDAGDVAGTAVADAAEAQKHALAAQTYAMILWPPGELH